MAPHESALAALAEHRSLLIPGALTETAAGQGLEAGDLAVAGTRDLGVMGFDVYLARGAADGFLAELAHAGAVIGDESTWDVLRVEAGTPKFGPDMDADTIPLEAGIQDRAISFTKGCYVGQEIIIRVVHRGHGRVARRLVGLAAGGLGGAGVVESAADAPLRLRAGDVLWAPDGTREVGRITSAVFSPALAREIALGYVARDYAVPGGSVVTRGGETQVTLTVTEPPLVVAGAHS